MAVREEVTQFERRLDNGLTVLAEHHPQAYSTAFALYLPLGAQHDPTTRFGLACVTQEVLFKGAGGWDAQALATEIDRIGFQENHSCERELLTFSGTILPQHLAQALRILRTVLERPHLPEAGLEEVRQLALHQLSALEDAPTQKMFYELGQRFFPSPLSNPSEGTPQTLRALCLQDVQGCWRQFGPQGAVLSVAGAFEPHTLLAQVESLFGDWHGPEPLEVRLGEQRSGAAEHLNQETEQTQIGVAYDSVPFSHPDYLKARMGVQALSGGMSSRLFVEVRQKRGLAYSVFATHITTKDFGGVLGYAGTTVARAQETLEVLLAQLRLVAKGITPAEFSKARTRLKTDYVVQGESTHARAASMARAWCYTGQLRSLDQAMSRVDDLILDEVNAYLKEAVPPHVTVVTLGQRAPEVV